ncbi:bifunctional DNA-binding transcriptional dual regulator/O6-methylguanine-DNA methyltransferase [Nocardia otitidiscaviarum]|uniref:Bifunctional DNA-binding transcriptional dual regulator/O6-methylguanine-DNA methyltransferase n=1 Tax=Nocardia otitidiscaviarum TaxID=1823 RepID=A0A379JFZ5_9NOCA|nr:helix-turn-helix domain-containing protein [Nocardia otitidiscaviarum]SUD47487.1 bifunctional DNA-binding transcriptional dual regulator/O6-methylguanine-DNA methyltransferase [Nocardia otitidiscaviarum]
MPKNGRDRLRELLDAVLDEDNTTLEEMAAGAYASPFHFTRQFSRGTGESPVALKRRVLLERAAWALSTGESVTEVAFAAGYDSVEGFSRAYSRAFGHPPSATTAEKRRRWLPAANGIHFHPPMSLWVENAPKGRSEMDPTTLLLHHDIEDARELLTAAGQLTEEQYRRARMPGLTVEAFRGPEASIAEVLDHLVETKECWLAAIDGEDMPGPRGNDLPELVDRHERVAVRWLDTVREIDRRGGWEDTLIDALCDPPESFVLGSVIAHVLGYSAHRRYLVRHWLRTEIGGGATELDDGDPINWLRRRE